MEWGFRYKRRERKSADDRSTIARRGGVVESAEPSFVSEPKGVYSRSFPSLYYFVFNVTCQKGLKSFEIWRGRRGSNPRPLP